MRIGKAAEKVKPGVSASRIEGYSRFFKNGKPLSRMVRISGNFMGGGFNLSQNKVLAVLENIDELRKFAEGEYDPEIDELKEDDVLYLD